MKKFATAMIFFSILLCSCAGQTSGSQSIETDSGMSTVINSIRQDYEERGYTEVALPATFEELCLKLNIDSTLSSLACTDIETASPEMREAILAARNDIIYLAEGWYLKDEDIYMVWFDNVNREWGELPSFDTLFPGWDIPNQ